MSARIALVLFVILLARGVASARAEECHDECDTDNHCTKVCEPEPDSGC